LLCCQLSLRDLQFFNRRSLLLVWSLSLGNLLPNLCVSQHKLGDLLVSFCGPFLRIWILSLRFRLLKLHISQLQLVDLFLCFCGHLL